MYQLMCRGTLGELELAHVLVGAGGRQRVRRCVQTLGVVLEDLLARAIEVRLGVGLVRAAVMVIPAR